MKRLLLLLALVATLAGCGSAKKARKTAPIAPASKQMEFNSYPQGATVYHKGRILGRTPFSAEIPLTYVKGTFWVSAEQSSSLQFIFVKDGYVNDTIWVSPTVRKSPGSYMIYPYGPDEVVYDFPNGAMSSMKERPAAAPNPTPYIQDPTIVAGEADARVSRDSPGATALERTIIRWYFDSEPRGARVFWRVISSIPSEVKNTNESYLGTTPFEQTRAFNILGLTYQNSRDVEIEVKLTCPGYADQIKRFNVRQAIDQAEISSFFDLVEKK